MTRARELGTGVGWGSVAEAYRDSFAPLCAGTTDAVLAAAGLGGAVGDTAEGLRVLDVGIGTGALAAAALATGAEVHGVDPDPGMLELARAEADGVTVRQGGLPELPYDDDGFDVVLANFVVNHVRDPRAGLRELARVARPGGRVVVTVWPSGNTVQSRLWTAVLEASEAQAVPSTSLPADLDFPRTVDGVFGLLSGAGLRGVSAGRLHWEHRTDPGALWRGAAAGIGGIGTTLLAQSDPVRTRMKVEYDRLVRPMLRSGRLVMRTRAILAAGTKG